ncbi:twin-arginine translocation pathway signal protein [Acidocella aromatica]|uniref:Uncharacterized protein n=1 Tax=Acidocella aromatica TaxID=1303579 RepID=A0A840VF28_9PROT|nr:twin-arginine translocation pathway signal protein [Acidocella aromatica]MBB5374503.1 hypothetical protein [Acidocella aromatica]
MDIGRRGFVNACGAASVLLVPGIANAKIWENSKNSAGSVADARVDKSIRASFGSGFAVRSHARANGLTYADIEHVGNRYVVASGDLQDWEILLSDRSL